MSTETTTTTQTKNTEEVDYTSIGISFFLLQVLVVIIYNMPYFNGKLIFIKYISYFLVGLTIFVIMITQKISASVSSNLFTTVIILIVGFIASLFISDDLADNLLVTMKTNAAKAKNMVN